MQNLRQLLCQDNKKLLYFEIHQAYSEKTPADHDKILQSKVAHLRDHSDTAKLQFDRAARREVLCID